MSLFLSHFLRVLFGQVSPVSGRAYLASPKVCCGRSVFGGSECLSLVLLSHFRATSVVRYVAFGQANTGVAFNRNNKRQRTVEKRLSSKMSLVFVDWLSRRRTRDRGRGVHRAMPFDTHSDAVQLEASICSWVCWRASSWQRLLSLPRQ